MLELHVIFKGEVQGVGFRATTRRFAMRLNLVGFVRNLSDGSVELLAQGPEQDLKTLLHELKQNFTIHSVDESYTSVKKLYEQFEILTSSSP